MSRFKTPLLLAAATAASRLPFASRSLYNMDSVQFALATESFDVSLHQPQPPGYFLYVMMGRLARLVAGDANTALVALSVIFSALTVVMLYCLGKEVFGEGAGISAALIAMTSPLVWFHGEVALSYMPEAFMSVLVAYLCYRVLRGEHGLFWLAFAALGVAGGIRQNTAVFLMPLCLYSMRRIGPRRIALGLAVFLAVTAAWAVPMLQMTGGYERFHGAMRAHWLDSNWRGIHVGWILFNARHMSYFLLSGLVAALAPLILYAYLALAGRVERPRTEAALFFAVWLAPAFLFHLVVFTHPAVPGHSLIYMVGLILLAGRALEVTAMRAAEPSGGPGPRGAFTAMLAAAAMLDGAVFLFDPYAFSARGIREHDRVLAGYIDAVQENFSPSDTEIIGSDRFLYSYRHAMYYLPEFRVHDTAFVSTPEGPRLLWGVGRRTRKAPYITPLPSTRKFVDFINYGREDAAGFPKGAKLHPVAGGHILAAYDSAADLRGVKRIAPFLAPADGCGIP